MDKTTHTKQVMKKRRVVSRLNLPTHIPASTTVLAVVWYRLWPPETVWGKIVMGLVIAWLAVLWISTIICLATETYVDIFQRRTIITNADLSPFNKQIYEDLVNKYKER